MPVIAHDPEQAGFEPGRLPGGAPLALDDELREAEAVVVVGRFGADRRGRLHGGPAALLPGLAGRAAREALAAALAAEPDSRSRARAAFAAALAMTEHVEIDFALVWNAGDPPAVRAGAGAAVFAACAEEGWLDPPPGSAGGTGAGTA